MSEEREKGKRIFWNNVKRSQTDLAYMVTADQCHDIYTDPKQQKECRFGANDGEKDFKKLTFQK